jgi:hypothetical protein
VEVLVARFAATPEGGLEATERRTAFLPGASLEKVATVVPNPASGRVVFLQQDTRKAKTRRGWALSLSEMTVGELPVPYASFAAVDRAYGSGRYQARIAEVPGGFLRMNDSNPTIQLLRGEAWEPFWTLPKPGGFDGLTTAAGGGLSVVGGEAWTAVANSPDGNTTAIVTVMGVVLVHWDQPVTTVTQLAAMLK